MARSCIEGGRMHINRSSDRERGTTYTGWCHAGRVNLMFGAFAGGGKNSLIWVGAVEVKCLLVEARG